MIVVGKKYGVPEYIESPLLGEEKALEWLLRFLENPENEGLFRARMGEVSLSFSFMELGGKIENRGFYENRGIEQFIAHQIPGFLNLPFVEKEKPSYYTHRSGGYIFCFFEIEELRLYVKHGAEGYKKIKEEEDEARVAELEKREVEDGLKTGKVFQAEDLLIKLGQRSEYGGSGGIGYFSTLSIACGSQKDYREWQWRDRFDPAKDNKFFHFGKITDVEVLEEGKKVVVKVVLDDRYTIEFTFKREEKGGQEELSVEEQKLFSSHFEKEVEDEMMHLMELWQKKPQPQTQTVGLGSVITNFDPYLKPRVVQQEKMNQFGIGAFVVEEQIDHSADRGRQIRRTVYLVKGDGVRKNIVSEHGYEQGEGAPSTQIVNVSHEKIIVNTENGLQEIKV